MTAIMNIPRIPALPQNQNVSKPLPPKFSGVLADGVTYRQNPDTGDHVFEGSELDLDEQIELFEMSVDTEEKRHVVTRAPLNNDVKRVFCPTGESAGFLNLRGTKPILVVGASYSFEKEEEPKFIHFCTLVEPSEDDPADEYGNKYPTTVRTPLPRAMTIDEIEAYCKEKGFQCDGSY